MGSARRNTIPRIAVASALVVGTVAIGQTSTGVQAAAEVTVLAPTDGEVVDQGEFTVRGSISSDGDATASIIFAIDVSGSTGASGFDCDGSGVVDEADDLNSDGSFGEILDCEIAGLISLNESLAAIPGSVDNVRVGVVPFGSSAGIADVGGNEGQQDFVAPTDDLDDNDRDRLADVVQVAASLNQGSVGLFRPFFVGSGTSFTNALNVSFDALENRAGKRIVYLLTDGVGSLSNSTLTRGQDLGIEVRPFAISAGSDRCRAGGALDRIAQASETECVYAADPGGLTTVITGQPSSIDSVTVRLDGGPPIDATIDPLGNFSAPVFLDTGDHVVSVLVRFTDGVSVQRLVSFRAASATRIVAMGDSYSAGEGITPFVDVPGAGRGCHQSTKGYPTLLGNEGFEIPGNRPDDITLEYVACSGAILRNLTAVPQDARGETHIVQLSRVDQSTDLITFTIGGNDVGFSEVMKHCATQLSCWKDDFAPLTSGKSLSADDYLLARVNLFLPQVGSFYTTLRERTDDNAAITVLNYPELFDDGNVLRLGCKEAVVFTKGEREWINDRTRLFRDLLARTAARSGVWFIDVVDEFKGHRVCDGGINDNGEWIVGHETAAKAAGDASFHPNAKGAEAYARLIAEFLNARVDEGVPLTPSGLPANPGVGPTGFRSPPALHTSLPATPEPVASMTAPTSLSLLGSLQQADLEPYPAVTADSVPTPEELGFSAADLEEIAAMSFDLAEVTGLAARRGDATCSNVAALGEQLVVEGHGFVPGGETTLFLSASTEPGRREVAIPVIANERGLVAASIIIPPDLIGTGNPLAHAHVVIGFEGTDIETRGYRRVDEGLFVDDENSECTMSIVAAGDVSPDGSAPAPSAANTPGVPNLGLLPGLLEASGCRSDLPIEGLEWIVGTSGDDVIVGTDGDDFILAGDGDDDVAAGNGNDVVCGGRGDDVIDGGNGEDHVDGGDDDDEVSGGNGRDAVYGSDGDDYLYGDNGPDHLDGGDGVDVGDGGNGKDTCVDLETMLSC